MKTLNSVLENYEKNRQKAISSLELNQKEEAKRLLEEYVGFSYGTLLDNTTKAQVSFSQSANNLLEIEEKEIEQLDNFKQIKTTLIEDRDELEEKIVVLDATAIEKQQYLFDLKNLELEATEKTESLLKEQSTIKEGWKEDLSNLDEKISTWESDREERLAKENEERLYEHNIKMTQIKDIHEEKIKELNRTQEMKEISISKDITIRTKELESNLKKYEESKEYLEKFDTLVSDKVSKQVKIKLGFIKQDHDSKVQSQESSFTNQLDILDLKIANLIKNSDEKRVTIAELKEKLDSAKIELNKLTQNTLSV